jgi:two-component system chemotaxis response regulator CheB
MQTEVRRIAEGLQVRVFPAGRSDLYAPSVDRLFASASRACAERMIAVIMTGMGDDGAEAMKEVHERGGLTIAESSESAIIFGMPNEAIRTGAIDEVLPLPEIPRAIQRLCTN